MGELPVADVLNKAADLIEPEGRWVQGVYSRDETGRGVRATDEQSVCWCAAGALWHIAGKSMVGWQELEQVIGADISLWNDADGRTQAEVVQALREAAALALSTPAVRIEDDGGAQ